MSIPEQSCCQKPNVCLLGASFGTPNFGVNVLTLGTIRTLLHGWPEACISILDYAYKPELYRLRMDNREIEIPMINIRFSKKPWQPNHILFLLVLTSVARLLPREAWRRKLLETNLWLRHLNSMDVVTAISGGDSFSDIYGMKRFFYTSLPQILALLLGKKLVLLPQTLGPYRWRLTQLVARYILRRSEVVYSRDLKGLRDAEELLGGTAPAGKLRFSYDVGFVVDPVRPANSELLSSLAESKKNGTLVGLNVSGLLFMGGYTRNNMFGLETQYDQLVYQTLNYFLEQERACVLLVPHVQGAANTESDSDVCRRLYEELHPRYGDQLQLLPATLDEREVKYVIGQCDFFVGARMHACIAALSQAVPTLPIAYSDKFKGVMESIGAGIVVADPRRSSAADILEQTRTSYNGRREMHNRLQEIMPRLKEKALNIFPIFERDENQRTQKAVFPGLPA